MGSTRGITDSTQTVTDSFLYDGFGNTITRTGTTPTPFCFVGAEQYQSDGDSGLQLLGHRYYDPSIGRFLSSDPAKAGTNWYAYCNNNPLNRTDANGEFAILVVILVAFLCADILIHSEQPADLGPALPPSERVPWMSTNLPGNVGVAGRWLQAAQTVADGGIPDPIGLIPVPVGGGGTGSGTGSGTGRVPVTDPGTGVPIGRFIGDSNGNIMIEPVGGETVRASGGGSTHTLYPNDSIYQRLDDIGLETIHGHGHQPGTGPGMRNQGPSTDPWGRPVPWNSPEAHWPAYPPAE